MEPLSFLGVLIFGLVVGFSEGKRIEKIECKKVQIEQNQGVLK